MKQRALKRMVRAARMAAWLSGISVFLVAYALSWLLVI